MFAAVDRRTIRLVAAVVVLVAILTLLFLALKPAVLWDWFVTLASTFVSVLFAVALFWYQRDKNDQERQLQLLISLAAEARATLHILGERPAEIRNLNEELLGTAVLTHLPTAILDEAIRSGLHLPSDTEALVVMAAHVNAYNSDVSSFAALQAGSVKPRILQGTIERLRWRQDIVSSYCQDVVDKIGALDLPEPKILNAEAEDSGNSRPRWRRMFGG